MQPIDSHSIFTIFSCVLSWTKGSEQRVVSPALPSLCSHLGKWTRCLTSLTYSPRGLLDTGLLCQHSLPDHTPFSNCPWVLLPFIPPHPISEVSDQSPAHETM